jgi:hypothetical protein
MGVWKSQGRRTAPLSHEWGNARGHSALIESIAREDIKPL